MTKPALAARRLVPRLLTVAGTAEHLQLSTKSVRRLITSGAPTAHRIGRGLRVSEDDLSLFLSQRRG